MAHIGIDARLTHYRTGGISTYTRRLVAALADLTTAHRITVFHSRKAQQPISDHFPAASLWTPPHHRLERIALSVELLRHRLDVLLSPDFIPPWRGARRHIITVHDLNFLYYPQYLTADSRRYYNDQIETAVKQADHILAVSQATCDDLIKLLAVSPHKITVQPHGVDERFRPLTDAEITPIRHELDLPPRYILHVGTLEPRKNIAGLLHAYHDLLRDMPDAPRLLLVGRPGWLFDETEALIRNLNLQDHLLRRESVTDAQLPAVYNMADVLVMPSFYEGFGLPALEAMACGTIPIVSNRSSLPEVVGDTGLLIDPDDPATLTAALKKALTDSEWREQQQIAVRERAALFTWQRSAQIALDTVRAVL